MLEVVEHIIVQDNFLVPLCADCSQFAAVLSPCSRQQSCRKPNSRAESIHAGGKTREKEKKWQAVSC